MERECVRRIRCGRRPSVLEKNAEQINYDLDQEDTEDRCSMTGVDLMKVVE
jgi:hypothetical protein